MKRASLPLQRRAFIAGLGGAVAWSMVARAQQGERVRRIGVLLAGAEHDPEYQGRNAAFMQGLKDLGWTAGGNVRFETRWAAGEATLARKYAGELVTLVPDVIVTFGGLATGPVHEVTRTIPIVFAGLVDPVASGLVTSLARPGGNVTGFLGLEYAMGAKWLELLKEVAPRTTRVAVLRDATQPSGIGQLGAVLAVAGSFGVELTPVALGDGEEIERAIAAFAQTPNGGMITVANTAGGSSRADHQA
jgi:putative ABC transport system substrate-binding protein